MAPLVYIAAPFELQKVARAARTALGTAGIAVSSRWLDVGADDSDAVARLCLEDVAAADALVAINPREWARLGTGGRHVELGYALALGKRIVIVGARTNVFHQHSAVHCVGDMRSAVRVLQEAS